MKQLFRSALLSATFAALTIAASAAQAAAPAPCEDMLKEVRAAAATAKLSDADKAKVAALQDKGIERCNADDDKRADDFFGQALKLMGK
ncbi:photosystem II stability/assembly factor-like uncharacterized protein [Kaistia hirudinis]|uniref:Photosystem II stability/assembly factor-like uncharacterized protein n=1 Tax=Kaistia hirudinis TaxID=1293440 RepID=A0A840AT81_9HYPH|nr:hypothetical protein [Kaistia hirudinis]MBB3932428.1 photosystem II stability/assembly factor-like uncharacterized protein [Kaistia hirudinis]